MNSTPSSKPFDSESPTLLSDISIGVQRSNAERLRNLLIKIHTKKVTGRLSLVCPPHRWYLFFDLGQCVYATGSHHRVRRWNRVLQINAPDLDVSDLSADHNQPWEYYRLTAAIYHNRLTPAEGITIALMSLREVFFAIISSPEMSWHWHNTPPLDSAYVLGLMLDSAKIHTLLDDTIRLHRQWTALGLNLDYVNGAPLIQAEAEDEVKQSNVFSSVYALLDGKHSFWDIALISPTPLVITTRIVHHFLQQGLLTFQPLADLPYPNDVQASSSPTPSLTRSLPQAPLIACIDDSEQICYLMEKIITNAGYRFLGISNSLKALPELLEYKPDFIFLDLVMPVVGGYELCKQLRRVSDFRATPIVILTERDGVMVRMKSNMVGATDFLSKPIAPEVLLNLISHNLRDRAVGLELTEMVVETAIQNTHGQFSMSAAYDVQNMKLKA